MAGLGFLGVKRRARSAGWNRDRMENRDRARREAIDGRNYGAGIAPAPRGNSNGSRVSSLRVPVAVFLIAGVGIPPQVRSVVIGGITVVVAGDHPGRARAGECEKYTSMNGYPSSGTGIIMDVESEVSTLDLVRAYFPPWPCRRLNVSLVS
jgi:hypothetical protein